MKKSHLISSLSAVAFVLVSLPTTAALIDNGGGLIYDDVLDITWAQPDTTVRTWNDANAWADGLTLGGATEWRLPYVSVAEEAGPTDNIINCGVGNEEACRDNELGYMYWQNLGGTGNDILGSGDPDLALFPTLQSVVYWSGTQSVSVPNEAWWYAFLLGNQGAGFEVNVYTWAVHAGNVGAVPVPAAVWLFGSGLIGLIGVARKKKAS